MPPSTLLGGCNPGGRAVMHGTVPSRWKGSGKCYGTGTLHVKSAQEPASGARILRAFFHRASSDHFGPRERHRREPLRDYDVRLLGMAKAKAKPFQRKKAAPKRRPRKTQKSLGVPLRGCAYDPSVPVDIPTSLYEGEAVPVSIKGQGSYLTVAGGVSTDLILCAHNCGRGANVYWFINNAVAPFSGTVTGAQMTADAVSGGPTSARAMKSAIMLRNYTQTLNVAGRVYALVTNRRIELPAAPSALTQAQVNTLRDEIINHPDTSTVTGHDLVAGRTWFTTPHDITDYLNYDTWGGSLTLDDYASHNCIWPSSTRNLMPMCAVWLVIRGTATTAINEYQAVAVNRYYARFPLDQLLSNMQRPVPTASTETVNKMREASEAIGKAGGGSTLLGALGNGVFAAFGNFLAPIAGLGSMMGNPKASPWASYALKGLGNAMMQAMPLVSKAM